MACYHLLHGFRSRLRGSSGKLGVVFNVSDGYRDMPVVVACGQCWGCRLERSRQWAVRCMHEASLYEENCFLTLTYADEFLPKFGSLDKAAFPKFMKRLRKLISPKKVRFFHAGEYGARLGRPHYHACLFGHDFADKVPWSSRGGYPVWRSGQLEALWACGQSELGSVTFESAAYVARYIMKKVTGENAGEHYSTVDASSGEVVELEREYTTMSRRPGIGKPWLDRFMCEVYPEDSVVVRGRLMKPPRFYDLAYELTDSVGFQAVGRARRRARRPEDQTVERLEVREQVAQAKASLFKRSLP